MAQCISICEIEMMRCTAQTPLTFLGSGCLALVISYNRSLVSIFQFRDFWLVIDHRPFCPFCLAPGSFDFLDILERLLHVSIS